MFNTIIELLARQACVIIPGLGGFVVNDCAARNVDGKFFPPRKELVFNPKLVHNDGDLAHALMKRDDLSFDEANSAINQTVLSVWSSLKNDGLYVVPGFGVFTMKSGKIAFQQKDLKVAFDDTFGLDEFYFPVLDKKLLKKGDASSSNHSTKTFLMGAAAVLAFLLVGQPLKDSSRSDMASLAPMMVSQSSLAYEIEVQKSELNQLKSELTAYKEGEVDYYLIVAEFSDEASANDYIASNEGSSLSLLRIKQNFYVTAYSAKTKDEIASFCDSFPSVATDQGYMLSVAKFNDDLK